MHVLYFFVLSCNYCPFLHWIIATLLWPGQVKDLCYTNHQFDTLDIEYTCVVMRKCHGVPYMLCCIIHVTPFQSQSFQFIICCRVWNANCVKLCHIIFNRYKIDIFLVMMKGEKTNISQQFMWQKRIIELYRWWYWKIDKNGHT